MGKKQVLKTKSMIRMGNEQSMEDRIGQLPDEVIGVILSHLTMEEAGRMCVLSHRWKNLWTLTPHFNFDASKRIWSILDHCHYMFQNRVDGCARVYETERRKYISWVDQFVENHGGSDLCELVLVFAFFGARDSRHLDKWIDFALRKRVKAIKINLFTHFIHSFGQRYSFLKSASGIPGIGCLTSLCLKYVDITGEMIEKFLSVCPLLERLSLTESTNISNLRIVCSSLKLKYLDIYSCAPLQSFDIYAPNLLSLYFNRKPGIITKLQVDGLCSLVDLCIGGEDINYEWRQFSGYFPQLATLALSFHASDFDTSFFELHRLPQLTNLRHLSISILFFHRAWMYSISKFINVSCPFLHKFTLELPDHFDDDEEEVSDSSEDEEDWGEWYNQRAKECPHQCLKVVEMLQYVGESSHIEIVEYILNCAIKLEKLIIDPRWQFNLRYPNGEENNELKAGSRKRAERLKKMLPPGVELLIM